MLSKAPASWQLLDVEGSCVLVNISPFTGPLIWETFYRINNQILELASVDLLVQDTVNL